MFSCCYYFMAILFDLSHIVGICLTSAVTSLFTCFLLYSILAFCFLCWEWRRSPLYLACWSVNLTEGLFILIVVVAELDRFYLKAVDVDLGLSHYL